MIEDAEGESYGYDEYNRLTDVGGPSNIELAYDPVGRLRLTSMTGVIARTFLYDGLDLIAEYDGTGTMQARYVHGPGMDEPLVQYVGASLTTRQWLHADERGSIVAVSNASGVAIQINSYDEYGVPGSSNATRFGYTGQVWLPETGLYHYKNRAYNPALGRFMQADPIGVSGGMNLYAYVGGDPVNFTDPLGLRATQCQTIDLWYSIPDGRGGITAVRIRVPVCIEGSGDTPGFGHGGSSTGRRGLPGFPNTDDGWGNGGISLGSWTPRVEPISQTVEGFVGEDNPFGLNSHEAYMLDPQNLFAIPTPDQLYRIDLVVQSIQQGLPLPWEPYDNNYSDTGARLPDRFGPYIRLHVASNDPEIAGQLRIILGVSSGMMFITVNHYDSFIPVEW